MLRIRRVEEEIIRLYPTDKIKSPVHLSIGQESVAVGVCEALDNDDVVFGTYRGHALYLAKGGDVKKMMAELFGKSEGCGRGKAGSMHLVDPDVNMMGTSAIVATGIPNAVGYAMALKMQGSKQIVTVFFGDGAMDEGVFHESVNFASLKELPIIFICENNTYAIYSHVNERMKKANICERAAVYGLDAMKVDDGDPELTYKATLRAANLAREGKGPSFIECMTYRWRDHVGPDEDRSIGYRPDKELDDWISRDQVAKYSGLISLEEKERIDAEVEAEIEAAIDFAERSDFPANEEIFDYVIR